MVEFLIGFLVGFAFAFVVLIVWEVNKEFDDKAKEKDNDVK